MDLADLRAQIHDGCSVAVQVERRIRGQRDPARVWMGLRGFGHDDAVMADYVLLNDPTADTDGAVNCTMAVSYTHLSARITPPRRTIPRNDPACAACGKETGRMMEQRNNLVLRCV